MSDYLPFDEDYLASVDPRKAKKLAQINEQAQKMLDEYAEGKREEIRKADLLRDIASANYFVIKPNADVNEKVEAWLHNYKRTKPRTKKAKASAEYSREAFYRSIELCEIHERARIEAESKFLKANAKIAELEKQVAKLLSQVHSNVTPIARPKGGQDVS